MKKWAGIIVTVLLLVLAGVGCSQKIETPKKPAIKIQSERAPKRQEVIVTRVIDGETLEVSINGKIEKVRLAGIDAPDKDSYLFGEATHKTKSLVEGKAAGLISDVSDRDKDGRLLRYVFVDDTFVNAELVRQGYATAHICFPDFKYCDLFYESERKAREYSRGIWAQKKTLHPFAEAEKRFVARKKSGKYHYPNCIYTKKIKLADKVWFGSPEEAQAKNYIPCRNCRPPGVAVAGESIENPQ